jgi:hypothetical protein
LSLDQKDIKALGEKEMLLCAVSDLRPLGNLKDALASLCFFGLALYWAVLVFGTGICSVFSGLSFLYDVPTD